jgi:hypothetical protein
MITDSAGIDALYRVRKNAVDIVAVPELNYLMVDGQGDPSGTEFADAVQALYSVAYGAHFITKKALGSAPKVMPLEALWWVEGVDQQDIITAVALGHASIADTDRDQWRWRAMIMQRPPVEAAATAAALERAATKSLPALERIFVRLWEEGLCAQTLHIGPYGDEGPSIVRLHEAITAAGFSPRGLHHEIYI